MSLEDIVDYCLEEIMEILASKAYNAAKEKGFHSDSEKENDNQNIVNTAAKHGMNLISEVVELWEWVRKGKIHDPSEKSSELSNIEEESADGVIRWLDTAKTFSVNLGRAMRVKWEINKNRPYRNGGRLA